MDTIANFLRSPFFPLSLQVLKRRGCAFHNTTREREEEKEEEEEEEEEEED